MWHIRSSRNGKSCCCKATRRSDISFNSAVFDVLHHCNLRSAAVFYIFICCFSAVFCEDIAVSWRQLYGPLRHWGSVELLLSSRTTGVKQFPRFWSLDFPVLWLFVWSLLGLCTILLKSYIRSIFTFKPFTILKIQVVEPLGNSAMSFFYSFPRRPHGMICLYHIYCWLVWLI